MVQVPSCDNDAPSQLSVVIPKTVPVVNDAAGLSQTTAPLLAVIVMVWVWFESPSVHVGLHDDGEGVRVMAGEPPLDARAAMMDLYLSVTPPAKHTETNANSATTKYAILLIII
jgi:hypothetical protein